MTKDVLYFFVEKDGRCRQIVNGVVTSLNKKTPLPQAPIGSREISIAWERSWVYFGNQRNFMLPLRFVMDAAKILRNDAYKFNIDRELYLLILRFVSEIDATNYRDYYKYLYKGQLDFSTLKDKQGQYFTEIGIMEGGINSLLKSKGSVQVDIPIDEDDEFYNIRMHGMDFENKANYLITNGYVLSNYGQHTIDINLLAVDALSIAAISVERVKFANNTELLDKSFPFLTTGGSETTIKIKMSVGFTCSLAPAIPNNPTAGGRILVRAFNDAGTGTDFWILADYAGSSNMYQHHTVTVDTEIVVPANRRLFLLHFLTLDGMFGRQIATGPSADGAVAWSYDNAETDIMELEYNYKAPVSYIKAHSPYNLYRKLAFKAGIPLDSAISELLQTCTYYVTSGDGVRGIPASIKTHLNDFFKAFHIYLMAGMSVEQDKLKLEAFSHFFQPDSVKPAVDLGEAKDFTILPANEHYFSSIKIGHAEQDIEDTNGKYDFNGYHIYSSPQKNIERELNLQSPYKAGPYEIEITRANLDGKTTTDNSNDNSVFVMDVVPSAVKKFTLLVSFLASGNYVLFPSGPPYFARGTKFKITGSVSNDGVYKITEDVIESLVQTAYTDITITISEVAVIVEVEVLAGLVVLLDRSTPVTGGIPEIAFPTIFNVRLSPDKLLVKHFAWLKSFLYEYDTDKLIFESSNRNADLISNGLLQKRDININEMGDPLVRPYYAEFLTQVPIELVDTMETDPNVSFATVWEGERYNGYNALAKMSPVLRSEQGYKLLLVGDTDLKKLI